MAPDRSVARSQDRPGEMRPHHRGSPERRSPDRRSRVSKASPSRELREDPRGFGGEPRGTRGDPRGMRGDPRGMRGNPREIQGDPRDMRGDPRDMRGDPRDVRGDPRDNGGDPREMRGEPRDPREYQGDPRGEPRMMDPRAMDPRMMDPRMMDPRMMDPREMAMQGLRQEAEEGPTPICRCRVLYLGSLVPHVTKDGLQGIQEPLKELYPEDGALGAKGIDSWLSVWSNGFLLENVDENRKKVSRFFPIDSLHYCAAVRYVQVPGTSGEKVGSTQAQFSGPI